MSFACNSQRQYLEEENENMFYLTKMFIIAVTSELCHNDPVREEGRTFIDIGPGLNYLPDTVEAFFLEKNMIAQCKLFFTTLPDITQDIHLLYHHTKML